MYRRCSPVKVPQKRVSPAGRTILLAALVLAAPLTLAGCGPVEEGTAASPGFQTTEVAPSAFDVTVEAVGLVEPIRSLEVKSLAAGEITALYGDVGDRIEAGSLLAEIDPRDVQNAFQEAQADLEVARARMEITRAQTERSRELLEAGVITQQEHEGRNLEFANARAALVKAETNMELADQRMADVRIRAPLTGTILVRSVDRGQVISSASSNASGGTTLFTMAPLDRVQVRVRIPEGNLGLMSPGLPVVVRPEAYPDRTFQGELLKVEPQAVTEQNVVVFPVLIVLDNPGTLLRPGMNVSVEILVAEYLDALTIPSTAVLQLLQVREAARIVAADLSGWVESDAAPGDGTLEGEDAAVFVLGGGGVVAPRRIRVAPGDGTRVRVLGGLEPGETVVDFAPPSQGGGGGRPPGR
jgi:HlyD family secretion protein